MKYRGVLADSQITGFLINGSGVKFELDMTKGESGHARDK